MRSGFRSVSLRESSRSVQCCGRSRQSCFSSTARPFRTRRTNLRTTSKQLKTVGGLPQLLPAQALTSPLTLGGAVPAMEATAKHSGENSETSWAARVDLPTLPRPVGTTPGLWRSALRHARRSRRRPTKAPTARTTTPGSRAGPAPSGTRRGRPHRRGRRGRP